MSLVSCVLLLLGEFAFSSSLLSPALSSAMILPCPRRISLRCPPLSCPSLPCLDLLYFTLFALIGLSSSVLRLYCSSCCSNGTLTAAGRQLNVKRVVMGCRNLFFGGCGSVISINAKSAVSRNGGGGAGGGSGEEEGTVELGKCLERGFKCEWGVEEEAAIELLRIFYSGKNPRAPNPKLRRKNFR